MKMIILKEGDNKLKDSLENKNCEKVFELLKDDEMIGIGTINKDLDDQIMIFIKKELRGNGYGKILFGEMKNKMKELGYEKINLKFEKSNIKMLKIVKDYGGLHLETNNKTLEYVVPIL